MSTENKNNSLTLNKSVAAISFASEGGKITHLQHKTVNSILLGAQTYILERYESQQQFEQIIGERTFDFKVPWSNHLKYIGFRSNATEKAKECLNALENLKIRWNHTEGDEIDEGFQAIISRARIHRGWLEFRMDYDIRRLLLSDDKTIELDLLITNHAFNNKYASFLYEHLLRNLKDCGSQIWHVDIETFRETMNVPHKIVDGEKKWSYPRFGDLKDRVITPAIKAINNTEATFFDVTFDKVMSGKFCSHLVFHIDEKSHAQQDMFDEEDRLNHLAVEGKLNRYELHDVAGELFQSNDEKDYQYLLFCLELFEKAYEEKAAQGDPIGSPAGYFKTMLSKNKPAFEIRWKEMQSIKRKNDLANEAKTIQAKEDITREETRNYRESLCDEFMAITHSNEIDALKLEYVEQLDKAGSAYKHITSKGWHSPLVMAPFREYLFVTQRITIDQKALADNDSLLEFDEAP